jgi:GTP-binding protein HflX
MTITGDLIDTEAPQERAVLVGAQLKKDKHGWGVEDSLAELGQLARTAGLAVAGQTWQRLERYHSATLVGSGKVQELRELCNDLDCDVIVFDEELSARQLRNLEEVFDQDVKILDRTGLILDIFAQHARTKEGRLQVELAQYEYRLPRLTRAWTHLARQAGGGSARGGSGGVGLRGPGETQLEVDRREIGRRIAQIKGDLEQVRRHRRLHRRQRKRQAVPVVAIVGYTNAGKSTLLNALSGSDVLIEDKLFATLDPTTRRVSLPNGGEALFTDTVGFIQKLPTELVAAFRATLEEINEADVVLHVVDITHPNARQQSETVMTTLEELGVQNRPVVVALNKIDLLPNGAGAKEWVLEFPDSLPISAAERIGLAALLELVETILASELVFLAVEIPYARGELTALFHEQGTGVTSTHGTEGILLEGYLPSRWVERFRSYVT